MARKGYRITNLKNALQGLIDLVEEGRVSEDELETMISQCIEASPLFEKYQKLMYERAQKLMLDPDWVKEMFQQYQEDFDDDFNVSSMQHQYEEEETDLDMSALTRKVTRPVFLSLVSTSRKRIKEVLGEKDGEALIRAISK